MKNLLNSLAAAALVLGLGSAVSAQTVNGYKLNEIPAQVLKVGGVAKMSGKWNPSFDYGQTGKSESFSMLDDQGEKMKFESIMQAINMVASNGWELLSSQVYVDGLVSFEYFYFTKAKE